MEDDWFVKEQRRNRWMALEDDGPIFGLVPSEEAELQRLRSEFAPPSPDAASAEGER